MCGGLIFLGDPCNLCIHFQFFSRDRTASVFYKSGPENLDVCEQEFGEKDVCWLVLCIGTGVSIILIDCAGRTVDFGLFPSSEYLVVVVCSAVDWDDVGLGG